MLYQLQEECEYLLETLEDSLEKVRSAILICDEYLYQCDNDNSRKVAEQNLFYLDSIKFSIKELLNVLSNLEFNSENCTTDDSPINNIIRFPCFDDTEIWVDSNEQIPLDIYKPPKQKPKVKFKIVKPDNNDNE